MCCIGGEIISDFNNDRSGEISPPSAKYPDPGFNSVKTPIPGRHRRRNHHRNGNRISSSFKSPRLPSPATNARIVEISSQLFTTNRKSQFDDTEGCITFPRAVTYPVKAAPETTAKLPWRSNSSTRSSRHSGPLLILRAQLGHNSFTLQVHEILSGRDPRQTAHPVLRFHQAFDRSDPKRVSVRQSLEYVESMIHRSLLAISEENSAPRAALQSPFTTRITYSRLFNRLQAK